MAIRVDVYTNGGMASGLLARACPLREALSAEDRLQVDQSVWQGLEDRAPRPAGTVNIADRRHPVRHRRRRTGATGPRRLAPRPAGFGAVHARGRAGDDARASIRADRWRGRPANSSCCVTFGCRFAAIPRPGVSVGEHALVNRYAVEAIRADLMLGFFFPGAAMS